MAHLTIDQTALITDSQQRTWHVLERDDGSVSVYYTKPDDPAHYVVWDEYNTYGNVDEWIKNQGGKKEQDL